MSDEIVKQAEEKAKEISSTNDVKNDSIPYDRFKSVNEKAKEYEAKFKELEAKLTEQEENKMLEENNLKGLLEKYKTDLSKAMGELEPLRKQKETMDQFITAQKNALLEKLPEGLREKSSSLDLDTLQAFADEFTKSKPVGTSNLPGQTGKTGNFGGFKTLAEWAEKDPHGYATARREGKIRIDFQG